MPTVAVQEQNKVEINSMEELKAHASEKGLTIPNKEMDFMTTGLAEGKVKMGYLKRVVNLAAGIKAKQGSWHEPESKGEKSPIAVYHYGETRVPVYERTNGQTGEKFLSSMKPGKEGKLEGMSTAPDMEKMKSQVEAYFSAVAIGTARDHIKAENEKQKGSENAPQAPKPDDGMDI